jgi:uncharacterized protein
VSSQTIIYIGSDPDSKRVILGRFGRKPRRNKSLEDVNLLNNLSLRRFVLSILLVLLFVTPVVSAEDGTTYMVPMRDGVKLHTIVWLPEGSGPWPVILVRTPYPPGRASGLVEQGYAYVLQNTRGRHGSEGENVPFLADAWGEHQDGYDCVQWVATQTWCNGKIGGLGGSAPGITQYLLAGSAPPQLTCQWVGAACSSLYHQAMHQGGAFRKAMVEGWMNNKEFDPSTLEFFRKNTTYNELWKGLDLTQVAHRVNVPVYHQGGWYDIFLQGNIDAFVALQYNGGPGAIGNQKLVIQPRSHGGRGDLKYPDNSREPDNFIGRFQWLDQYLKGDSADPDTFPAVAYYLMGDVDDPNAPGNVWKYSDHWPVKAKQTAYYLRTYGRLTISPPPEKEEWTAYRYDPKDPVPTRGGQNLLLPAGPMDQRQVENRSDVLVFTTDPLKEPVEVTGRVTVRLYASSSAVDTDFTAKLSDVYPDGRSMLLTDGIIRARHRKSFEREEFLKPGAVYEFEIDLWSTAIVFNKGHRIRLAVSSSNYPRFDANPNTGRKSGGGEEPIVAINKVFFDASRPSALLLPIVQPIIR